jgi:hypothetical protein
MSVSASAPEPPPLERHHHRLLHQIVSGSRPGSSAPSDRRRLQLAATATSMDFAGLPGAAIAGPLATAAVSAAAALLIFCSWFLPYAFVFSGISRIGSAPYTAASGSRVQASRELRVHDFRLRSQNVSGAYLPFQLGVRLLRNASIPSRKSSLI